MEAIKKKMQSMKVEKDNLMDRCDAMELVSQQFFGSHIPFQVLFIISHFLHVYITFFHLFISFPLLSFSNRCTLWEKAELFCQQHSQQFLFNVQNTKYKILDDYRTSGIRLQKFGNIMTFCPSHSDIIYIVGHNFR